MGRKRSTENLTQVKATVDFQVKQSGDAVFIEGFANKNVIDRGNEVIDPEAWDLENFMKNPVILFNHGLDPVFGGTPIGMATMVKPMEEGLFLKVRLSNSKSPLITMVRDLVQEKILKAFSVGFESKEAEVEQRDGKDVRVIKSAELFETSVVGIPMNQDSLFELSGKMLKTKTLDQVENMVCEKKGAWVAGAVHHQIYQLLSKGEFDREKSLEAIAKLAEVDLPDLKDILAGDVTPVPEPVLEAFAEVLGLDLDELKQLDAGDLELSDFMKQNGSEDEDEDDKDDEKEKSSDSDSDDDKEDDESEESKALKKRIKELLDAGESPEDAVAKAFSELTEDANKDQFKEFLEYADGLVEAKQAGEGTENEPDPNAVAIQTEPDATDFGNPHLEQAKQTNVMLGTLVSKMDALIDVMTGAVNNRNTEITDEKPVENDDGEKALLDSYKKRLENIKDRIKNLS